VTSLTCERAVAFAEFRVSDVRVYDDGIVLMHHFLAPASHPTSPLPFSLAAGSGTDDARGDRDWEARTHKHYGAPVDWG
jgi:hypothetical protein